MQNVLRGWQNSVITKQSSHRQAMSNTIYIDCYSEVDGVIIIDDDEGMCDSPAPSSSPDFCDGCGDVDEDHEDDDDLDDEEEEEGDSDDDDDVDKFGLFTTPTSACQKCLVCKQGFKDGTPQDVDFVKTACKTCFNQCTRATIRNFTGFMHRGCRLTETCSLVGHVKQASLIPKWKSEAEAKKAKSAC